MARIKKDDYKFEIKEKNTLADHSNAYLDQYSFLMFIHSPFNRNKELSLKFGYRSNQGKNFDRSMNLYLGQTIQLRDFLNKYIQEQIHDSFNWININPFIQKAIKEEKSCLLKGIVKVQGFTYQIMSKNSKNEFIPNLRRNFSNESHYYYFPVYSVPILLMDWIESLYEQQEDELKKLNFQHKTILKQDYQGKTYIECELPRDEYQLETIVTPEITLYHTKDFFAKLPTLTIRDRDLIINQFISEGLSPEQAGHNLNHIENDVD